MSNEYLTRRNKIAKGSDDDAGGKVEDESKEDGNGQSWERTPKNGEQEKRDAEANQNGDKARKRGVPVARQSRLAHQNAVEDEVAQPELDPSVVVVVVVGFPRHGLRPALRIRAVVVAPSSVRGRRGGRVAHPGHVGRVDQSREQRFVSLLGSLDEYSQRSLWKKHGKQVPHCNERENDPRGPRGKKLDEDEGHQSCDKDEVSLLEKQRRFPVDGNHANDAKVPHDDRDGHTVNGHLKRQRYNKYIFNIHMLARQKHHLCWPCNNRHLM